MQKNRHSGVVLYLSNLKLFIDQMATDEGKVWSERKRAVMDAWVGSIGDVTRFGDI